MNEAFLDYYRGPEQYADFQLLNGSGRDRPAGYFRFGGQLCYGRPTVAEAGVSASDDLPDLLSDVLVGGSTCFLPFNLSEVITNLRQERYVPSAASASAFQRIIRSAYYL